MNTLALPVDARRQRLDGLLHTLGLSRDPFPVTPDYESYFFSPRLRQRYEDLLSAVALRKGFVLVTGDVGVGKTTLARLLIDALQAEGMRTALVINTFVQGQALLGVINRDFGLQAQALSIEGLLAELHAFLLQQYAAGANCVLVIDDAQALSVDSLELIRQLSNLETSRHKLLQIVLVGQPELLTVLERSDLRQLRSRIAMHLQLEPMSLEEMDAYLHHRLAHAGNAAAFKVEPAALRSLWAYSAGYPRRIHLVMDRCLFGALARQCSTVDERLMREAIAEVQIAAPASPPAPTRAPRSGGQKRMRMRMFSMSLLLAGALGVSAALALTPPARSALEPAWTRAQAMLDELRPAAAALLSLALASTPQAQALAVPATPTAAETALTADMNEAVASALAVDVEEAVDAHEGVFARVPPALWQSFWARQAVEDMAPAATLGADVDTALAVLDAHLQGSGRRALLLAADTTPCAEHLAVHMEADAHFAPAVLVLAAVPVLDSVLEFGQYSPTVRWMQQRLQAHGLYAARDIDAVLGPVTVSVLARFQREHGLAATGSADARTLYRLSCAPAPRRMPMIVAEPNP